MNKKNDHKKKGFLGWDDGCALRVLSRRKTPYGRVWLCEVVHFSTKTNPTISSTWLEAKTENQMLEIGPDCNYTVPEASLFKKI